MSRCQKGDSMDYQDDEKKLIPVYFKKSNAMISSKSNMTLLGRKIYDAAAMVARKTVDEKGDAIIRSDISGEELQAFIGCDSSNSLYNDIKNLIKPGMRRNRNTNEPEPSLLDWKIIVMEDEKQHINGKNIITEADFSEGHMYIIWNKALEDVLLNLKANYTLLNKSIISQFKSKFSYQLYQLLKQTIDREMGIAKKKNVKLSATDRFELKIDLIDLKAYMGVIDPNINPILYNAVKSDAVVTFDECVNNIKDEELLKTLKEYKGFRKYALERAKKDINEISDIEMEYEPLKKGRGGKVVGFTFTAGYKEVFIENTQEDSKINDIDKLEFLDEMRSFMKYPDFQKSKNLKSIAEAAHYDMDLIKTVYKILESPHTGDISNPTGWMIKGCKEGYEMPKSKKKTNDYNSFEQNTYDFKELEKRLVKN